MAGDFRRSSAAMAKQLRVWQRLQQSHRDMGDTEVTLDLRDLFSEADAAALAAYEADLAAHNGLVPLPMQDPVEAFAVCMPIAQFKEEVAAGLWPRLTPEGLAKTLAADGPVTHMTLGFGTRAPIVLRILPVGESA